MQKMVHAYNATTCRSTGYSPFYFLFGREPQLPIDLLFGCVAPEQKKPYRVYVEDWKTNMEEAYKVAAEVLRKVGNDNKNLYDAKATAAVLPVGARVLVRNLREKGGPGKLRAYWERKIYRVLERRGEGPVYVVHPEKGGEVRVLHRNHLLPVGEKLRELDEEPEESEPKSKPKSKSSQKEGSKVVEEREEESSETSEDESKKEEARPKRRRRKPID